MCRRFMGGLVAVKVKKVMPVVQSIYSSIQAVNPQNKLLRVSLMYDSMMFRVSLMYDSIMFRVSLMYDSIMFRVSLMYDSMPVTDQVSALQKCSFGRRNLCYSRLLDPSPSAVTQTHREFVYGLLNECRLKVSSCISVPEGQFMYQGPSSEGQFMYQGPSPEGQFMYQGP